MWFWPYLMDLSHNVYTTSLGWAEPKLEKLGSLVGFLMNLTAAKMLLKT